MLKPKEDKRSIDIGILVSDIEKSLHFYHTILGIKKTGENDATTGRMYRLRYCDTDIKLVVPRREPKPGIGPIGLDRQLGLRYFSFVVTNLDEVVERLEEHGVPFTFPKKKIRPQTTIAMVEDPDGNIVEFVERGPEYVEKT